MWWFGIREFIVAVAGVPGGLAVEIDGEMIEIGGIGEESLTLPNSNGMTILADLDGDGVVDHVTMHNFAGGYEIWSCGAAESGWGLAGPATANPSAGWGLESEVAPERGREKGGRGHLGSPWVRIDKG